MPWLQAGLICGRSSRSVGGLGTLKFAAGSLKVPRSCRGLSFLGQRIPVVDRGALLNIFLLFIVGILGKLIVPEGVA